MSSSMVVGLTDAERLRNTQLGIGVVIDPYPRFDELRPFGNVHEGSMWSLFDVADMFAWIGDAPRYMTIGYDACVEVFRRNDAFSSAGYGEAVKRWGPNILSMDEPEHRRYRALVQPAFSYKVMEDWESRWLGPLLDELIDQFPSHGSFDLLGAYCARFPIHTIASAFGIDRADVSETHQWAYMVTAASMPDEADRAWSAFSGRLQAIIDERRQHPSDDLIGLLAASEVSDDEGTHRLTDEEILGFAGLMVTAGGGTTYRTMGTMLLQLLQRPALLDRVRADRSLIVPLIEETIRWNPPNMFFPRLAVEDVEVEGVRIPSGSLVDVVLGAGNRDPQRWERPNEFDIDRPILPHISFGSGPHFCVGNQLARMELRVALERLLDRVPRLRLDHDADLPVVSGLMWRLANRLPVVVD
jgi:cytochrome P450